MDSQIVSILTKLQKDITYVKKKLEELDLVYGSKVWWKWSDSQALSDYKSGRSKTFSSQKALKKYLDSLKS